MTEEWRPVLGYEGLYEVSNLNRFRSIPVEGKRKSTGKIRTISKDKDGYSIVICRKYTRQTRTVRLHRAVAQAFIPNPDNLPQVNHKDGDKTNNAIANLEWISHLNNVRHAFANNLVARGEDRKHSKLTWQKAREIRAKYVPHIYSQSKLAREYGVSQGTIDRVVNNETWKEIIDVATT